MRFVAFADCAAAESAARSFADRLIGSAPAPSSSRHVTVRHASGRPWLIVPDPSSTPDVVVVSAGDHRMAVLGPCAADIEQLTDVAAGVSDPVELCRTASRWPGSFHLVWSGGGRVVVSGTASGFRRVYTATVGTVTVAADLGSVLAEVTGAEPDPGALAVGLLAPSIPHSLSPTSVWQGVRLVAAGDCLTLGPDGGSRTATWWNPPQPRMALGEAAPKLAAALRDAVAARFGRGTPDGQRPGGSDAVSADMSGGLDSTTLCRLAAEHAAASGTALTTFRVAPSDPSSDDPAWAAAAADALPGVRHLVFRNEDIPLESDVGIDERPVGGLMAQALLAHTARVVAGYGSVRHLTGYGGDEVLGVSRAYLRDFLPRHPIRGFGHLRAHRALSRWTWRSVVRALLESRSYPRWRDRAAAELRRPSLTAPVPQFGWEPATRLPPWATERAEKLIVERLARGSAPSAPTIAQHRAVSTIRDAADAAHALGLITERFGVRLEAPFLDDAVVEVALGTELEIRGTPYRYKALLAEAIEIDGGGSIGAGALAGAGPRRTKGVYAAEGIAGLRHRRARLLELCTDSMLARHGLIDPDRLQSACLGLDPTGRTMMAVEATMALETWLRVVCDEPAAA